MEKTSLNWESTDCVSESGIWEADAKVSKA